MTPFNKKPPSCKGSGPFGISQEDLLKVGRGAFLAAGGGLSVWLANQISTMDLTTTQGIVYTAIASIALNFLRKYLTDTQPK